MASIDAPGIQETVNEQLEMFVVHNGRLIVGTTLTKEQSRSLLKIDPDQWKRLYIRRSYSSLPDLDRLIMDALWNDPAGRWRIDVLAETIHPENVKPEEQSLRKIEAEMDRRMKSLESMGYLRREMRRNPRTRRDAVFLIPY